MDISSGIPLNQLILSLPESVRKEGQERLITGISADSRRILPGYIFVACLGEHSDGQRFIPHALANGAAAVVGTHSLEGMAVPYIRVEDSRLALARLAAAFYGFPDPEKTKNSPSGGDQPPFPAVSNQQAQSR